MDNKKREWFAGLVGAERAAEIIEKAGTATKDLEGLFSFKAEKELEESQDEKTEEPVTKAAEENKNEAAEGEEKDDEKTVQLLEGISAIVTKANEPFVAALKTQDHVIEGLVSTVKALDARLTAMETSQEEAAAAKTNTPRAARIFRATESSENIVDSAKAKELVSHSGEQPAQPTSPVSGYIADLFTSPRSA